MKTADYDFEAPNMDCCGLDDLKTYARIFTDLAQYAKAKHKAMEARLDGRIVAALILEKKCDRLYKLLPLSVRW